MNADLSGTEVRKATGWMIALSAALIVLGLIAIFMPGLVSIAFTLMLGWILLIGGIVRIVQSFQSKLVRGFWLNLLIGILYAITGLYVLFNPVAGVLTFTLALGIMFIVEGIFDIIVAFRNRVGGSLSWLVVLDGVVTLILGILVVNQWPSSAVWLIGLYVGISLLTSGISLLAISLATRRALASTPTGHLAGE